MAGVGDGLALALLAPLSGTADGIYLWAGRALEALVSSDCTPFALLTLAKNRAIWFGFDVK